MYEQRNNFHTMKQNKLLNFIFLVLLFLSSSNLGAQEQGNTAEITILSFNDFHGAYAASNENPGAARFVDAILKLQKENPNAIILSGGDNIAGSYFARITRGEPFELFSTIPTLNGKLISAVGNHEFDWGLRYLLDTAALKMQYLTANIRNKKPGGEFDQRIEPYTIVTIPMFGDSLRVGIIGLTADEHINHHEELEFTWPPKLDYVQKYCDELKDQADMIVILAHIATQMESGKAVIKNEKLRYLKDMEDVDAIVSAHSHNVVLGSSDDKRVPIIQAGTNGQYIGRLKFSVTKNNGALSVKYLEGDTIKTKLNAPLHNDINVKVEKVIKANEFDHIYCVSNSDLIHNRKNLWKFTEVGALVTASYVDAYKQKYPLDKRAVIGVNHFKGIRTGLSKGNVTKLDGGNVLPFGGDVKAFEITGAKLKELILSGLVRPTGSDKDRGFLQSSNISLKKVDGKSYRLYSVNKEGQQTEILDSDQCVVVCDSYLAGGGDSYDTKFFKKQIPGFKAGTTDTFLSYLKKQKNIPNNNARVPEL